MYHVISGGHEYIIELLTIFRDIPTHDMKMKKLGSITGSDGLTARRSRAMYSDRLWGEGVQLKSRLIAGTDDLLHLWGTPVEAITPITREDLPLYMHMKWKSPIFTKMVKDEF